MGQLKRDSCDGAVTALEVYVSRRILFIVLLLHLFSFVNGIGDHESMASLCGLKGCQDSNALAKEGRRLKMRMERTSGKDADTHQSQSRNEACLCGFHAHKEAILIDL